MKLRTTLFLAAALAGAVAMVAPTRIAAAEPTAGSRSSTTLSAPMLR